MGTIRLTAAQALVRYLEAQMNEDGERFLAGIWAITSGGGDVLARASSTGRTPDSLLPNVTTLADADVRVTRVDGRPVRGLRSLADGSLPQRGLVDVLPRRLQSRGRNRLRRSFRQG